MSPANVEVEYEGARLGDKRRSDRLVKIANTLARDPGLSFPAAMASEGQLEGFYCFLNSGNVTFDEIIRPHVKKAAARCHEQKLVIIVHDTSPLQFEG
jgi:Transposase DNA-binding